MAIATRYERVVAHDSGEFDAFCAVPGAGAGPGVVLSTTTCGDWRSTWPGKASSPSSRTCSGAWSPASSARTNPAWATPSPWSRPSTGRRADVAFHRYEAGHAFSNWDAPSMYEKSSADLAWDRTLEFLDSYLGRRASQ